MWDLNQRMPNEVTKAISQRRMVIIQFPFQNWCANAQRELGMRKENEIKDDKGIHK